MSDLLLRIGFSNLCLSLALATVAFAVGRQRARPHLSHLLWLLVLGVLVTPPLVTAPVVSVPGLGLAASGSVDDLGLALDADALAAAAGADLSGVDDLASGASAWSGSRGMALVWLLGSLVVLGLSLTRVARFHRWLGPASEPAPAHVQRVADDLAGRLGLARTPAVEVVAARLSPMVWWVGGPVRVLLPAELVSTLDATGLRHVLGHELAHVRRRDHLVRWLEWLACVAFWWNPVAWWARHQLRVHEELCCDALVLEALRPEPRPYATSLLTVAEFLSVSALRPPALASGIDSGGSLERRFTMILSSRGPTPVSRLMTLALAVALLPLGVAHTQDAGVAVAQDLTAEALREQIHLGELSVDDARLLWADVLPPDWVAEKYQAVADKLDAGVAEGHLTAEEAELKKEQVAAELQAYSFHIEVLGQSPGHARRERDGLKARMAKTGAGMGHVGSGVGVGMGVGMGVGVGVEHVGVGAEHAGVGAGVVVGIEHDPTAWMAFPLHEAGVSKELMPKVIAMVPHVVIDVRESDSGEAYALDAGVRAHLVEVGLSDEQLKVVVGIAQRIVKHEAERDAHFKAIIDPLLESGLPHDQVEVVLSGITKAAHSMIEVRLQEATFDFDSTFGPHFMKLGLNEFQVELSHGLAMRMADAILLEKEQAELHGQLERREKEHAELLKKEHADHLEHLERKHAEGEHHDGEHGGEHDGR
jgi:beta-lactamase regulating signal transducer with metallopeptidase domain